MRRHDAGQRAVEPAIRRRIVRQNSFQAALVDRDGGVRIGFHKTVARKMFAAIGHAALQQTVHQTLGQQAHHARVTGKSAVANHTAFAKIKVQYRREAEVHTAGAQLGAQHKAAGARRIGGLQGTSALAAFFVVQPHVAQGQHRWQMGKAIGLETLHPAAFVVDADQQVFSYFFDLLAQLLQLRPVLPVAGKQNHAPDQRVLQALAVSFGQTQAGNVDDEGRVLGHERAFFENKLLLIK